MTSTRIVIVGAGGSGRGARDVIDETNATAPTWTFQGYLDDAGSPGVIGRTGDLGGLDTDAYIVAISDPGVRARLDTSHVDAAVLVSPSAVISQRTAPGPGALIRSNCSVASGVTFGRHVHLNMNVAVGHDVWLGGFTTIFPGVTIGGGSTLESGVTIGSGATILPGVRIGSGAVVGAGAVVLKDVEPHGVVGGVPAAALRNRVR